MIEHVLGFWAIEIAPVNEDIPMLGATLDSPPTGYSARATFQGVKNVVRREPTHA